MQTLRSALLIFTLLLGSTGLQAEEIAPSGPTNPAPAQALSAFDRFEVRSIALSPQYADKKANKKALAKLQENLDARLRGLLDEWNQAPARHDPPRRLLIEPRVEKIKFIGGGARFWAGALAGKSALLMRVRLSDADSGALIAEPEFYQHAAAMAGAWTVGGADNAMLARAATVIGDYLQANHASAVGGPTSPVEEKEKSD